MPAISVIVPIFNVEKYLEECLESLINQTFTDIEFICINDGSTDNSFAILEKYRILDSRIKVINKRNTGYGHTMNVGISYSCGDYIGIVESDDYAEKNMFELLHDTAIREQAEVVKSNYFIYKSVPYISREVLEVLKHCEYDSVFKPLDKQNIFDVQPSIWSGLYKRKLIMENHIQFLETPGAAFQDTSFIFKLLIKTQRAYLIRDSLLNYRCDNDNASVKSKDKAFCVCREFEEIEKYMDDCAEIEGRLDLVETKRKVKVYNWNYHRLHGQLKQEFLNRISPEYQNLYENKKLIKSEWTEFEWNDICDIIMYKGQSFCE